MINTKYNIGDKVCIEFKVTEVHASKYGTSYKIRHDLDAFEGANYSLIISEDELYGSECLPVSVYEDEINDLKDEVVRLRNNV